MANKTRCWVWASVLVVAAVALPAHAIDCYAGSGAATGIAMPQFGK
jgi:hypothetical protein